jgi:valyl-tRNA synthetase
MGRSAFIRECLTVGQAIAEQYRDLWRRLGLSVDWLYTYRTIDEESRRLSQWAFLDLLRRDLAYRAQAPAIWCPECRTAIAQAELNDLERETTFYTLAFGLDDGRTLPIATTRPEWLPACVAVFVHPTDERFQGLIGRETAVPLAGRRVPILADLGADPTKGTGAVMCCTFGDTADITWWRAYDLPLIEAIGRDGRMTRAAGPYVGLPTGEARRRIVADLMAQRLLTGEEPAQQTVRTHERCDTPVEYHVSRQWFIRLLDHREAFLEAGERIAWHPPHMKTRYRQWVENLNADWCISRQRYFGVPFPLWYCAACGAMMLPEDGELPVDPTEQQPSRRCACGSDEFRPETDVMDTWATSSLSPQIVGLWRNDDDLFRQVFPMALRPQGHEIIRTWAFYTIVRAHYHQGQLPWGAVAVSGWGVAGEGQAKLSKRTGDKSPSLDPMKMMEQYSADAVRFWASGTGLGRDTLISEERIQAGMKLVNKLWNVGRFAEPFLDGYQPGQAPPAELAPADRWLLARANQVIAAATMAFEQYDYATARAETETFFWRDLADNYLEMVKKRLYDAGQGYESARFALHTAFLTALKLLAPFLSYVTEALYLALFAANEGRLSDGMLSIHLSHWPEADARYDDSDALAAGERLIDIATAVRRFKSERNLSLGAELAALRLSAPDPALRHVLQAATIDLMSITRAAAVTISAIGNGEGILIDSGAVEIRVVM